MKAERTGHERLRSDETREGSFQTFSRERRSQTLNVYRSLLERTTVETRVTVVPQTIYWPSGTTYLPTHLFILSLQTSLCPSDLWYDL